MKNKVLTVVFVLLLVIAIATALLYTPIQKKLYPIEYKDAIDSYAEKFSVQPQLVAAVIYCESSFRSDAVSHAGAVGLMQIMPETFEWLSRLMGDDFPGGSVNDAETNIACGTFYLHHLLELFENTETALAGYNAGQTKVAKWLNDEKYSSDGITLKAIPISETASYVEKVMKVMEIYKKLYYSESENGSN